MSNPKHRKALELIAPIKVPLYDKLSSDGFLFRQGVAGAGWSWSKQGLYKPAKFYDSLLLALEAAEKHTLTPVVNPDFSKVVAYCKERVTEYEKSIDQDSDLPMYIYEAAMKAVFGEDIFDNLSKMNWP